MVNIVIDNLYKNPWTIVHHISQSKKNKKILCGVSIVRGGGKEEKGEKAKLEKERKDNHVGIYRELNGRMKSAINILTPHPTNQTRRKFVNRNS